MRNTLVSNDLILDNAQDNEYEQEVIARIDYSGIQ